LIPWDIKPEPALSAEPCRLMHLTFELKQLRVATDAPFSVAFVHVDREDLGAFALMPAHGGLVLGERFGYRLPGLEPEQAVEAAELFQRHHAFGRPRRSLARRSLAAAVWVAIPSNGESRL